MSRSTPVARDADGTRGPHPSCRPLPISGAPTRRYLPIGRDPVPPGPARPPRRPCRPARRSRRGQPDHRDGLVRSGVDGRRGRGVGRDSRRRSPERTGVTAVESLEVLDLRIELPFATGRALGAAPRVPGEVRPGELEAYIAETEAGTLADAAAGRGPAVLYLAADPPDRFVTISLWPSWQTHRRRDRRRHPPTDDDQGFEPADRDGRRPTTRSCRT